MAAKEHSSNYVPLQVYSSAALLDGIHAASSPTALVTRAHDLEFAHIALTDPTFIGLGEFMNEGARQKIHTIPGSTFEVQIPGEKSKNRVTALATNADGLNFLFHVATLVLAEGKEVTPDTFSRRRSHEGVLLYWHDSSEIVDSNPFDDTNFLAIEKPTLGPSTKNFRQLHEAHLEKMVVMPPVTMATPKDLLVHEFLAATHSPSRLHSDNLFLNHVLKSGKELSIFYPQIPEAMARTVQHAELSNVKLPQKPETKAKIAGEEDSAEFFTALVLNKLAEYEAQGVFSPTLKTRVETELQLIKALGFSDYMLMSYEIAQFCEENQINFMVSGSANNSVVLWLLGVVKIDPQSLLFERFINAERGDSLPDTDFLLAQSDVAKVMNFLTRRYPQEVVRLCKISHLGKDSIIKLAEDAGFPLTPEKTETLVQANIPSGISTHASGAGMDENAPLLKTGSGKVVSHWDAKAIEKFRHKYKFDFLGSLALTNISDTLKLMAKHGIFIDIPVDDQETYEALLQGKTTAIVYGDTPHLQQVLRDVGSVSEHKGVLEVSEALALARLNFAARGMFLDHHYQSHPFMGYPEIQAVLKDTRQTAIYQDQLLELATNVIGLSWKEADTLRKMMSENVDWQTKEVVLKNLAEKLRERNYPPEVTELLQQQLSHFNSYSFVEGHSLALAHLLYIQSYLSREYPAYFWAGVFTRPIETDSKSKYKFGTQVFINEMLRQGIHFTFPPHLPRMSDVDDAESKFIIPGPTLFGSEKGKKKEAIYQQFLDLLETEDNPAKIIAFQQKHFAAVLTQNPVEMFPREFAFDSTKSRQTIIAKVVLKRQVGEMLYVSLDGTSLINAVMKIQPNQVPKRNSFYKFEIGASANRDDQWVILNFAPPTAIPNPR